MKSANHPSLKDHKKFTEFKWVLSRIETEFPVSSRMASNTLIPFYIPYLLQNDVFIIDECEIKISMKTVENVEGALLYRTFRQDLILCAKDKGTRVSHQYALSLS